MFGTFPDLEYVLRRFRRLLIPITITAVVTAFAVGAFAYLSGSRDYRISFKIRFPNEILLDESSSAGSYALKVRVPTSDLLPMLEPKNTDSIFDEEELGGIRINTSFSISQSTPTASRSQETSSTEITMEIQSDSRASVTQARDKYIEALTERSLQQIAEALAEKKKQTSEEMADQVMRINELDSLIAEAGDDLNGTNLWLQLRRWNSQSEYFELERRLKVIERVANGSDYAVEVISRGTVTNYSLILDRSVPLASLFFLLTFGVAFVAPFFDRKVRSGADLASLEIGDLIYAIPRDKDKITGSRSLSILKSCLTVSHQLVAVDERAQSDGALAVILSQIGSGHNVRLAFDSEGWAPAESDVVVLVASWGVSNVKDIELLARDLHHMGARFGGWILVNVPQRDCRHVYTKSTYAVAAY